MQVSVEIVAVGVEYMPDWLKIFSCNVVLAQFLYVLLKYLQLAQAMRILVEIVALWLRICSLQFK